MGLKVSDSFGQNFGAFSEDLLHCHQGDFAPENLPHFSSLSWSFLLCLASQA